MDYLVAAFILLCVSPAVFIPSRFLAGMLGLAAISFIVGVLGLLWPGMVPADFFTRHPDLANSPLHPQVASVAGGILFLFGLGLALALATRTALLRAKVLRDGR